MLGDKIGCSFVWVTRMVSHLGICQKNSGCSKKLDFFDAENWHGETCVWKQVYSKSFLKIIEKTIENISPQK